MSEVLTMGIIIAIVVLATVYLFLIAPRLINRPDMSKLHGAHYAHRGLHDNETDAPENSMKAFKQAVDAGYGIELDVQMTADGQVVVTHDFNLKRICGVEKQVNELTYAELQQYPILKSDERIPLFTDFLKLVDGKVPLVVELKCRNGKDPIAAEADKILREYKGVYCIESFDPRVLLWYKKNHPEVVRGQLSGNLNKENKAKGAMKLVYWALTHLLLNVATRPDFIAYDIHYNEPARRLCRLMGAPNVAWTVRTREEYEKAKKSYDLFIFEKVKL